MSMLSNLIRLFVSHIPLVLLILALIISTWVACTHPRRQSPTQNINTFIAYIMLLPIGFAGIWGFIMHAFFANMAAHFIGWQNSPFQFEVAAANLGLGLAGIFSFSASKGFRNATALFTACFLWGAAIGHVRQMMIQHNFHPGNSGAIFYTDIIIPLLLIILLMLYNNRSKHVFITK